MKLPQVTIITPSCDKYSDLWMPFYMAYQKYWPDCPFPRVISSNYITDFKFTEESSKPNLIPPRILSIGEDKGWSSNLINLLSQIQSDFILMHLEDLFISTPVNTKEIINTVQLADLHKLNYVSLNGSPQPKSPFIHCHTFKLGIVPKGTLYRASTVFSLWRKTTLIHLLKENENAWEFEINGTARSKIFDNFYSSTPRLINHMNGVVKGKWDPLVYSRLKEQGILTGDSTRPAMNKVESWKYKFYKLRSFLLYCLPSQIRSPIRNIFKGTT